MGGVTEFGFDVTAAFRELRGDSDIEWGTADEWDEPSATKSETAPAKTSRPKLVTLEDFAATEEEGAEPLLADADGGAVIPEGGDVMIYGDGGAGKTTLANDLACHLGAGDDWLGLPIADSKRVLLVELEGPRPLFRKK